MTWGDLKGRSDALPLQRAIVRFGVDRLWAAIDTCPDLRRRIMWARALVVPSLVTCRGVSALARLQPDMWWLGVNMDGPLKDGVEVPAVLPERWGVLMRPGKNFFFSTEGAALAFLDERQQANGARVAELEAQDWCEVDDRPAQSVDDDSAFWWDVCRRAGVPWHVRPGFLVKHRALDGAERVLQEDEGAQLVPAWVAEVGPEVGPLRKARRAREEDAT